MTARHDIAAALIGKSFTTPPVDGTPRPARTDPRNVARNTTDNREDPILKIQPNPAHGARTPDLTAIVAGALREAVAAQPHVLRATPDGSGDFRAVPAPTPAAALRFVDLTAAQPLSTPAAPDLLGLVRAQSVLAGLGLSLIVMPDQDDAMTAHAATGSPPVAVSRTARGEFSIVSPLDFATVDEDQVSPQSPWPATVTEIRHSGLRQQMTRIAIPRSMQKDRPLDVLASEVAAAVVAGIGRAVDRVALASLLTGDTPVSIGTWRSAVAAGTAFDSVRAVAGTATTTPALQAIEGRLFVDGVAAVTTDQAAGSFVGDWATHAAAIGAQLGVLVKKTANNGALEVTAFFAAGAVSPTSRTRIWRLTGA